MKQNGCNTVPNPGPSPNTEPVDPECGVLATDAPVLTLPFTSTNAVTQIAHGPPYYTTFFAPPGQPELCLRQGHISRLQQRCRSGMGTLPRCSDLLGQDSHRLGLCGIEIERAEAGNPFDYQQYRYIGAGRVGE